MHLFSILGAALASLFQVQPTVVDQRDIELRYLERFSDYSLFHRLGGSHNIDDHSVD